jgi:uncharacterized delta-60 repeat protein
MKLLRILNGLVVRIMARCAKELALLAGLIFFGFSAIALAQSPIDGFDPNANGLVNALAVQSDGKILVGGSFTQIGGQTRNRIARLNPDGTVDTTFNPNADNTVSTIAIQPDGKILVGGAFNQIGGQTRRRIARLNSDGSLDTTFPDLGAGSVLVSSVSAFVIALQSDGKILIGGNFTFVYMNAPSFQTLARLNSDGRVDTSFSPDSSISFVTAVVIQPDGKILVGTSSGIARLNSNGTLDTTFTNFSANNDVNTIALQSNGKILIGGIFNQVSNQSRLCTARLNTNGSLDTTFNASVGACTEVSAIALQPDGKILVGGTNVAAISGTSYNLVRLTNDTAAFNAFSSTASSITFTRKGAAPIFNHVTFELSTNGVQVTRLLALLSPRLRAAE